MIHRWGHGHSVTVGGLLTLALATHLWTLLVLVFLAGVILGRFWNLIHWSGDAIREKVLRARRDRRISKPVVVKPLDVERFGEFPRGY